MCASSARTSKKRKLADTSGSENKPTKKLNDGKKKDKLTRELSLYLLLHMYMHILFHVYSDKQKQVGSIIVVTESVNRDSSHDDKDVHVHTHVSTNTNTVDPLLDDKCMYEVISNRNLL